MGDGVAVGRGVDEGVAVLVPGVSLVGMTVSDGDVVGRAVAVSGTALGVAVNIVGDGSGGVSVALSVSVNIVGSEVGEVLGDGRAAGCRVRRKNKPANNTSAALPPSRVSHPSPRRPVCSCCCLA